MHSIFQHIKASFSKSTLQRYITPYYLIQSLVMLTLVCLPLQYTLGMMEPVVSLRMYYLAFVVIVLFILLYFDIAQNGSIPISGWFKKYLYVQLAFAGWILIGVFYALNYQGPLFEAARFLLIISFASICYYLSVRNKNFITYFFIALSISGLLQAGISFSYYYGKNVLHVPSLNNQPAGLFINRSVYAGYAALCLLAALGLFFKKHVLFKLFGGVIVGISFYILIVTQTRSALFGFALALVVMVSFLVIKLKEKRKLIFLVLAVGISVLTGITMFLVNKNKILADQLKSKFSLNELVGNKVKDSKSSSSTERKLVWAKTVQLWKENPVIGVGFGNWKVHVAKNGATGISWGRGINAPDRVHNVYLEILAETGIVGLVLFLATWVFVAFLAIHFFKQSLGTAIILELIVLFGIVICFSGDAFFTFTYRNIDHTLVFYACIALLFSKISITAAAIKNSNLIILIGALVGFYGLMAARGSNYFLTYIQKVNNRIAQNKPDEAIALVEKYKPSPFAYITDEGRVFEVFSSVAYHQAGLNNKAIVEGKKLLKKNPTSFLGHMNMASFYVTLRQYDSAKFYLKNCMALKPQYDKIKFELGKVYFLNNQCDSANYIFNTLEKPDATDAQIYRDSCRLFPKPN